MLLPWLVAVGIEFVVLRWFFRCDLAGTVGEPVTEPTAAAAAGARGRRPHRRRFRRRLAGRVSPVWPALAGVVVLAVRAAGRRG